MRARVRAEEGFGPCGRSARRGRPVSRVSRRAGLGVAYQLPAIVSTGLNAPCSTL